MKQLSLLMLICFLSCATGPIVKDSIYFRGGEKDPKAFYNLTLKEIIIKAPELEEQDRLDVKENALYILTLLNDSYAQKARPQGAQTIDVDAYIVIKEQQFVKDFETFNTLGLEIILTRGKKDDPASLECRALFTEETKETVTSYTFLYALLERSFKALFNI